LGGLGHAWDEPTTESSQETPSPNPYVCPVRDHHVLKDKSESSQAKWELCLTLPFKMLFAIPNTASRRFLKFRTV
jgi:hypothetical protein